MEKKNVIPVKYLPVKIPYYPIVTTFLLLDRFDAPHYLWIGTFSASLSLMVFWIIEKVNEKDLNIKTLITDKIIESIKASDVSISTAKSVNVSIGSLVKSVNIHEGKDSLTLVNSYTSSTGKLTIHYREGMLSYTYAHNKIEWDGLKHKIEFYEEDLDKNKFKLVE